MSLDDSPLAQSVSLDDSPLGKGIGVAVVVADLVSLRGLGKGVDSLGFNKGSYSNSHH